MLLRSTLRGRCRNGLLTRLQGKRLFIKDMAYYLSPPDGTPPSIAPTCARIKRGVGTTNGHSDGELAGTTTNAKLLMSRDESANPTVLPTKTLEDFHFVFLIRHPRYSIPSYYRCTTPPLDKITGFHDFSPNEAGYAELRRLFDYLRSLGQIGPKVTGNDGHATNGVQIHSHQVDGNENTVHKVSDRSRGNVDICMIDADDLLDHPANVVSAFCKSVGLEYQESMLKWDSEKDKKQAREAFEKWRGFHEDAMDSYGLKPRTHVSPSVPILTLILGADLSVLLA